MQLIEQSSPSAMEHAMLFGLELGVWFGANFVLSAMGHAMVSWLIVGYCIWFVYRCCCHYRDNVLEGRIGFGQGYRYILWLFFFASLVGALVKVVYLKWINPEYLGTVYEQTMEAFRQAKMSKEMQAQLADSLENVLQPVRFSVYYMLGDMLSGVCSGWLIALIALRRYKQPK